MTHERYEAIKECYKNTEGADAEVIWELLRHTEELTSKLESLLCYATGNTMSYQGYELTDMYGGVDDYIEKCIEEAQEDK